jgi:ethanolamine ammonia-lyase small subunit
MLTRSARFTLMATIGIATAAVLVAVLMGLRPGAASAQGILSAPACQCSATTAIPGLSTSVAHCLCGGVACVIAEHSAQGKGALMQCVK